MTWHEVHIFFRKEIIEDNGIFLKSLLKKLSMFFDFDEFAIRTGVPSKRIPKSKFFESEIPKDAEIVCDIFELGHDMSTEWSQKIDWRVGSLSFNWPFYDKRDPDYNEKYKPGVFGKEFILLDLHFEIDLNFSFSTHTIWGEPIAKKGIDQRVILHDLFLTLIEHDPSRIFISTEIETKEMDILPVYYDSIDTFLKVISYYENIPEISDGLKQKLEKNLPDLMAIAEVYVQKHKKGFSLHPKKVVEYYKMQDKMEPARPYKLNDDVMGKVKTKLNRLHYEGELIYEIILSFIKENKKA